jgi:two-component system nitrate/nitrite response regulator NarL
MLVPVTVTMVIIDDDPGFRRAAESMFRSLGVEVVEQAGDGASGLDAVRRNRPDWILLDVNLPDMVGIVVARTLHDEGCRSSILLASTGQSLWDDAELAAVGIHDYVAKDDLFERAAVGTLLTRQRP